MIKIMTIVGTRPELIKMSRVIDIFDNHTKHILVHTGQNFTYELNQLFFDDLNIRKPDYSLNIDEKNTIKNIAKIIESVDEILEKENPKAVLLYGDTNSCLSIIAVKKRNIPIFHMEAGNRCFDSRVPEEINRKIVDHLSDINFVLSDQAKNYLIREGIKPETIVKTGSHMNEIINFYFPKIKESEILKKLNLKNKKYFLISIHRQENTSSKEKLNKIISNINLIAEKYKMPIIISTHPRTREMIEVSKLISLDENIKLLKPFSFTDYIKLQLESICIISDSGTITEEAMLLNLPAITLRDSHERPEGNDFGALIMSNVEKDNLLKAIEFIIGQNLDSKYDIHDKNPYESFTVSNKIYKVVTSYIDYINRTVWYK